MKDWHCHILPGVDDGAADVATSIEMAQLLSRAGMTEVYCTPHRIFGLYDNTPDSVRAAVVALQSHLDRAGISIRLHAGMEYYLDEYFPAALDQPLLLGESNRLLVEIPSQADPGLVRDGVFSLLRKGLVPVIAHPERSRLLEPPPSPGLWQKLLGGQDSSAGTSLLEDLRAMGCLFQGNLGSFSGYYGRSAQQRAGEFAANGLYSCFGSDGHTAEMLQSCLAPGVEAVIKLQIT